MRLKILPLKLFKVISSGERSWAVTTFVFENFSSMKPSPFSGPQRMLNQLVTVIVIQSDLLLKVFLGLKVSHFKVSFIPSSYNTVTIFYSLAALCDYDDTSDTSDNASG